jgi:hypothetical protein
MAIIPYTSFLTRDKSLQMSYNLGFAICRSLLLILSWRMRTWGVGGKYFFSLSTGTVRARVFDRFLFDTPFTKNGKAHGGLEDQWKRRTVLQTLCSFPALVNRLLVIKSESLEFSPVENAIGMIETRTTALRNELEEPRSSEGDQLPRLQSLQRILQGSVAVQVRLNLLWMIWNVLPSLLHCLNSWLYASVQSVCISD